MEIDNDTGEIISSGAYSVSEMVELIGKAGSLKMAEDYLGGGESYAEALKIMYNVFGYKSCFACKNYIHDPVHHDLCNHESFDEARVIEIDTTKGCLVFVDNTLDK